MARRGLDGDRRFETIQLPACPAIDVATRFRGHLRRTGPTYGRAAARLRPPQPTWPCTNRALGRQKGRQRAEAGSDQATAPRGVPPRASRNGWFVRPDHRRPPPRTPRSCRIPVAPRAGGRQTRSCMAQTWIQTWIGPTARVTTAIPRALVMPEDVDRNHRVGVVAWLLVGFVRLYQRTLAHLIGGQCRYSPSCSNYAIEALRRHGAVRGTWLTAKRVGRCHPWGGGGDDPVP